jgi:hypothetical protein
MVGKLRGNDQEMARNQIDRVRVIVAKDMPFALYLVVGSVESRCHGGFRRP